MLDLHQTRIHDGRELLTRRYDVVRALSETLAAPLSAEDQCVQSMPDASPTKWHLAHTSWFFETVVLRAHMPGYRVFNEHYHYLFNSYYEALGPRQLRAERGLLSRPSLPEVMDYRQHVDASMRDFARAADEDTWSVAAPMILLGLNHEQQHQELLLTDIKHLLSRNALNPAYCAGYPASYSIGTSIQAQDVLSLGWVDCPGGRVELGHEGAGFAFDNETPRHEVLLRPYQLANRCVTNGEYLAFMADGGYRRPEFWLSDGWALSRAQDWRAPLYWQEAQEAGDGIWRNFTLHGLRDIDPLEPVCHLSLYEAAAYAQWAGARLPTEFEWEAASLGVAFDGRFLDAARLHPAAAQPGAGLQQMYGDVWEWTRSSYDPYPGFKPLNGVVGEYNGKFMVGQVVLRGGSCATPEGHIRPSYRNFFPPGARWQFSGLRLARDL
ncbi:ergothioneine biosynthesis protein EgtB [Uliginosibacterium sp. H3]|uniref:Ergothioneine biosynthesis protein EgtB n=1 Tax=Uliginosibacterium silvisoli TaxID=3114758 RepID=A0ABU6K067_9RHOO|nr:ergothioneine biosynthesis protein EgtB [Uliginosibacterium sp. H3]